MRVLLFMFLIDQLKIDYLRNGTYSYFVWFLFGLILAVGNVARREAQSRALDAAERTPSATALPRTAAPPPRPGVSTVPAVPPR